MRLLPATLAVLALTVPAATVQAMTGPPVFPGGSEAAAFRYQLVKARAELARQHALIVRQRRQIALQRALIARLRG